MNPYPGCYCSKWILPLLLVLFHASSVAAQYEYDFLGKGARAAGMAYAFSAVADDATAVSWNPAGITQVKRPELAFANSFTATRLNSKYDQFDYRPVYMVDYLGAVYPLKIKSKDLVFGLCLQNKMNLKYDYASPKSNLDRHEGTSNLTVNAVSIGGAYSITRFLSAGFSYNHWFSLGNSEHKSDEYNYGDTSRNRYEFTNSFQLTADNFTAGLLVDFQSFHLPLRLAVKYEERFVLKRDCDETWKQEHLHEFVEDTSWLFQINGVEEYYIPRILTGGIAYRFGNYLTLTCDLEVRLLSGGFYGWDYRYRESMITSSQQSLVSDTLYSGLVSYDKFSIDLTQYRFGVEYILHPKQALIPLRAGWKNNSTLLLNYAHDEPELTRPYSLNFGAGYIARHFSVDLAFEQYKYNRTDEYGHPEEKTFRFLLLSLLIYLK